LFIDITRFRDGMQMALVGWKSRYGSEAPRKFISTAESCLTFVILAQTMTAYW